jgi:hypothetical protein
MIDKKILIYKKILQLSPRILLTISYCNYNNQFIICQHNLNNCYIIKRNISLKIIIETIPFADLLI